MKFKKIEYIDRKSGKTLIEKVPGEGFLKFLYYNPFGELPLEKVVKRKYLTSFYGKRMDTPESCQKIAEFVVENNINMDESEKTIKEFTSFNDFFIRKLKKGAREVARGEDIFVSPADGKILVFENLTGMEKFFVKGDEFNLQEFLKDEKLSQKYEGGTLAIIRLAPVDYHRFHFPTDGEISESKEIEGYYYSVSPYAIRKNFRIFLENKREYSILHTPKFGDVLMAEIGATMVGGIVQSYKPNTAVKKGEEKGYFFFGGSTCILLFEKGKIEIDKDIIENSKNGLETKVYMGEKIGVTRG
jgi:phosphatidylserine decarboxylase